MRLLNIVSFFALLVAGCGEEAGERHSGYGSDVLEKIKEARESDSAKLDLSDRRLTELPSLEGLTKLESLSLRGNQISDLAPLALDAEAKEAPLRVYQSHASFLLDPLQARGNRISDLLQKHRLFLLSQEFRDRLLERIRESQSHMQVLIAPFVEDSSSPPANFLDAAVQYSVAEGGGPTGLVLTITALGRDAESAGLVAELVQLEYESFRRYQKRKRAEGARAELEHLFKENLEREKEIRAKLDQFKRAKAVPDLEVEKKTLAERKAAYAKQITEIRVEKVKVSSMLRQILGIQSRTVDRREPPASPSSSPPPREPSSASPEFPVATPLEPPASPPPHVPLTPIDKMKQVEAFFAIDVIESFGDVPQLRKRLKELERMRRTYEGHSEEDPKMVENAAQMEEVRKLLEVEVRAAIEDLRDKFRELGAMEEEFEMEQMKVLDELKRLGELENSMEDYLRPLQIIQDSTESYARHLLELRAQRAFFSDELLVYRHATPAVLRTDDVPNARSSSVLPYEELKVLDLRDNKLTDVMPLASLVKLERLNLAGNSISEKQKAMLKQALPDCEIMF